MGSDFVCHAYMNSQNDEKYMYILPGICSETSMKEAAQQPCQTLKQQYISHALPKTSLAETREMA